MELYQSFELQREWDGKEISIPHVYAAFRAEIVKLKKAGYKVFGCNSQTNGILHKILVGCDVADFDTFSNLKRLFYEIAERLELPFMSGEYYDESTI
jgi:hypothetical protein